MIAKYVAIAIFASLAIGVQPQAQPKIIKRVSGKYYITLDRGHLGDSELTKTLFSDGTLKTHSRAVLIDGKARNILEDWDTYGPNGRLIYAKHTQSLRTGGMRIVEKKYDSGGCRFKVTENGKVLTNKYAPLPKGKSTNYSAVFWFIATRPRPGTVVKFWNMEDNAEKWREKTVTYVGPANAVVNNKLWAGQGIIMPNQSKYILDDRGLPIQMQIGKGGDVVYSRKGL